MYVTKLSQSSFFCNSVVTQVRSVCGAHLHGTPPWHQGITPASLQPWAGASEHFRAWQLASVLALTAGCASTTEVRDHSTLPRAAATDLSDFAWHREEPVLEDAVPSEASTIYEIAFALDEEVDNTRGTEALQPPENRHRLNGEGSLDNEPRQGLDNAPEARRARSLSNSEKTAYEYNIYGGSTCVAGTQMGFSAPICP